LGRQKSGFLANIWHHRMLWTLRLPGAINTIVGQYLAIDRWLLELVLSTDGRPSSGVSQSRCKSVYDTESHAPVNTPKRREHSLIHAAVNLTRESYTNNWTVWPVWPVLLLQSAPLGRRLSGDEVLTGCRRMHHGRLYVVDAIIQTSMYAPHHGLPTAAPYINYPSSGPTWCVLACLPCSMWTV